MQFDSFDIAGFLTDFWQKRPLLIRSPWRAWSNPLAPDELAGLACESEVESRLVMQSPAPSQRASQGDHGVQDWSSLGLEHGPLSETRFAALGKQPWTLLVQAVDHHVPAVAALLEPFRFIPNWRIDDVMVSYATPGGGVGPHFDQYDVFLVQGLGKRRWQVGAPCDSAAGLLPHDDLRLLADFQPTDEWVLEPGDILYVPPRFGHNGVAISDDCMTYSVGFRAPSRSELIAGWCESLAAGLEDDDRYADPDLSAPDNPGEITADALDRLHHMITERVLDREAFARWFGQHSTAPKNPEIDWRPEQPVGLEDLDLLLAGEVPLVRNPASRFSFVRQDDASVSLFVDGRRFECGEETASFAEQICARNRIAIARDTILPLPVRTLLVTLLNQGSVAFGHEG